MSKAPKLVILRRAPKGGLHHEAARSYAGGQFIPADIWNREKAVAKDAMPGLVSRFSEQMQFLRQVYQMAVKHPDDPDTLAPARVEEEMRHTIHAAYEQAFILGKRAAGNLSSLNAGDNAAIRTIETDEYSYLAKFAQDMKDGAGFMSYEARMDYYGKAVRELFWAGWALANTHPERLIYWHVNPQKEHCETCLQLGENSPYNADEFAAMARLGFVPQSGRLNCRGYYCGCSLSETPVVTAQAIVAPAREPIHKFGSTQVNIDEAGADMIRSWADKHIDPSDLAEDGIEKNPHVTVRYGLKDEDTGQLEAALRKEAPFKITLDGFGKFTGNEEYDVLYILVAGAALAYLHKLIAKKANVQPSDFPTYTPHVTVAYLKKGAADKYLDMFPPYLRMQQEVNGIVISDRYGDTHKAPFLGPTRNV